MLNYNNTNLLRVTAHQIGNRTNGEDLYLSQSQIDISSDELRLVFLRFFLTSFSPEELYQFTFSNDDFSLNPVYNFAKQIFKTPRSFQRCSVDIAKHLYEISVHPQIKSGDLFVAFFENIVLQDEVTEAVGIFKSENKYDFINLIRNSNELEVVHQSGISVDKLDKGCLIFNSDENLGYKVCILDKTNKSSEAQFWKEQFLNLKVINNDSQQTRNFLDLTKTFLTTQLPEEFEVSKPEQIDLLNRSIEYFKSKEEFNRREFESNVLQDSGIIESFRSFNQTFDIDVHANFTISPEVVKKQARVFKSVLKLDGNFHIYIHGNKDLIQKGVEKDGRKYYKIYYEAES